MSDASTMHGREVTGYRSQGESLVDIAGKHGVEVAALVEVNPTLDPETKTEPGSTVYVPAPRRSQAVGEPAPMAAEDQPEPGPA